MKKLLLVGSSGFSGSYLTAAAAHRLQVFGVDRHGSVRSTADLNGFFQRDASNQREMQSLIGDLTPQFIINLAGTFSASSYEQYLRVNVDISRNILDACLETHHVPEKILLVGSAAEYGIPLANPVGEEAVTRPVTLYGLSKLVQTQVGLFYCRVHGLPVVVARTFNITGEGISALLSVGSFAQQIAAAADGGTIQVGNLATARDYLPIQDVVSRYLLLLHHGMPGMVYNVCSGRPKMLADIVGELISDSGKRISVVQDPSRLRKDDIPSIYGDSRRLDELAAKYGTD